MRTKSRIIHTPKGGATYGPTILVVALIGYLSWVFFSAKTRIDMVHKELFNSSAALSYSFDLENIQVVATAKIVSIPKIKNPQWKDLPFINQPYTYRIVHRVSLYSHSGTIELKVSDNPHKGSFVSSDVKMDFLADLNSISFTVSPFDYEAPEAKYGLGAMTGSLDSTGELKLQVSSLEVKMINYLFRFKQLNVIIPPNRNSINLDAKKVLIDEVELDDTRISFAGANPFEVKLNTSFAGQPAEIEWIVQKATVKDQDVRVGSGRMKFPVTLVDAYVLPKINRTLLAEKKEGSGILNEKIRFLENASLDVRRSEAKAVTLRLLSQTHQIRREGEFYELRVDKQDAFRIIEESAQRTTEKKSYLDSWVSLPKEKLYPEAFYALMYGDETRALAVSELLKARESELKNDPEFMAVKARLLLREAARRNDEYDPALVERAENLAAQVATSNANQAILQLLNLELALAKKNYPESVRIIDLLKPSIEDPQIQALLDFQKLLHTDNASALVALDKANSLNPKSLHVQNLLRLRIHANQHLGDHAKLEDDFKVLTAHRPTAYDHLAYSDFLEEKKDYDGALAAVQKCIDLDYQNSDCHQQREAVMAIVAIEKQKVNPDQAIAYLQNLLADRPASVSANAALGFLYRAKGEEEKSINSYSVACALGGALACLEAADYLARQGQNERSSLLYDIACDLQSGSGCLKAGLAFEKTNLREKAEAYFQKSCDQYHDNVGCYHLARSLQLKKAPNRSIAPYLDKACKLYDSACKLASVYQTTNKQPEIPLEPK